MDREQALKLLKENISNENLRKHCFAVEAVMGDLAFHFGEDKEKWKLTGLLHDIDYEKVKDDLKEHSLIGAQMLQEAGLEVDICQAVRVHNEAHGILPETQLEKALFVSDPLTGLIVASTLVLPSKKISDLESRSILKHFKEKNFAQGVNREIIKKCQEYLNLTLEELIEIALRAMQGIDRDLGL